MVDGMPTSAYPRRLIPTVATIVFFGLSASSIAMHVAAPDAALVNDLLGAVR